MYVRKCHNSVRNNQNLPIDNPKRDILYINTCAKCELNPLMNTSVIERKNSADAQTDERPHVRTHIRAA